MNSWFCRGLEQALSECSFLQTEIPLGVLYSGQVILDLSVSSALSVFRAYSLTCFIGLDYPYVISLLSNNTIEIHSVETQEIVQVIGAPAQATSPLPVRKNTAHGRSSSTVTSSDQDSSERVNLIASIGGHLVPSTQRLDKLRTVPIRLLRT